MNFTSMPIKNRKQSITISDIKWIYCCIFHIFSPSYQYIAIVPCISPVTYFIFPYEPSWIVLFVFGYDKYTPIFYWFWMFEIFISFNYWQLSRIYISFLFTSYSISNIPYFYIIFNFYFICFACGHSLWYFCFFIVLTNLFQYL